MISHLGSHRYEVSSIFFSSEEQEVTSGMGEFHCRCKFLCSMVIFFPCVFESPSPDSISYIFLGFCFSSIVSWLMEVCLLWSSCESNLSLTFWEVDLASQCLSLSIFSYCSSCMLALYITLFSFMRSVERLFLISSDWPQ